MSRTYDPFNVLYPKYIRTSHKKSRKIRKPAHYLVFVVDIKSNGLYIMDMPLNIALKVAIMGSKHKTQRAVCKELISMGLKCSPSYLAKIVQGRRRATP